MQVEKRDKEVCVTITIPISETEPNQCPKVETSVFDLVEVQRNLHNSIIARMDKCCAEVGEMLAKGNIKADEHCMYGSGRYFSFDAFDVMRQLAAKSFINLEDRSLLELTQILKALVYLPESIHIKVREKIFDAIVDELVRKCYAVSLQDNNKH